MRAKIWSILQAILVFDAWSFVEGNTWWSRHVACSLACAFALVASVIVGRSSTIHESIESIKTIFSCSP